VKVGKAHEGFGPSSGCNTPDGGYGPSQDEKPWGRGLRALLDTACDVLRDDAARRRKTRADLRIGSEFCGGEVRLVRQSNGATGRDDMKLDQIGVRDDDWLASRPIGLQEIMLDREASASPNSFGCSPELPG